MEFDVHLSKDKIPVVYHDFAVALTLRKVSYLTDLDVKVYLPKLSDTMLTGNPNES